MTDDIIMQPPDPEHLRAVRDVMDGVSRALAGFDISHIVGPPRDNMTATEVQMRNDIAVQRIFEYYKNMRPFLEQHWQQTWNKAFGPKRKRWDQYGAYHRRQSKKREKRRIAYTFDFTDSTPLSLWRVQWEPASDKLWP